MRPKTESLNTKDTQIAALVKKDNISKFRLTHSKIKKITLIENPDARSFALIYFNETTVILYSYRIIHYLFQLKHRKIIDGELHDKIQDELKPLTRHFGCSNLPHLESHHVYTLYQKIKQYLVAAKQKADEVKKPLLVLFGDDHYSPYALLCQMIVFEILKPLGLTRICFEFMEDAKNSAMSSADADYHCDNMDTMCQLAKKEGIPTTPVDPLEYMNETWELVESFHKGSVVEEKFNEQSSALFKMRDEGLAQKITKTHDTRKSASEITLFLGGGTHLCGIAKDAKIMNTYQVFSINCCAPEGITAAYRIVSSQFLSSSSHMKTAVAYMTSAENVLQLPTKYDCSAFTNFELHSFAKLTARTQGKNDDIERELTQKARF